MQLGMGMTIMSPGDKLLTEAAETVASHHKPAQEMDAYERVLGDAMAGDATLFAREDCVEEAWRIVDLLLGKRTMHPCETHTWGPEAVDHMTPPGGWNNPVVDHDPSVIT